MPLMAMFECCTLREDDTRTAVFCVGSRVRRPVDGPPFLEKEESQQFFDCIELEEEECPKNASIARPKWWLPAEDRPMPKWWQPATMPRRLSALVCRSFRTPLRPLEFHPFPEEASQCLERTCLKRDMHEFTPLNVVNVAHIVRKVWEDRIAAGNLDPHLAELLGESFNELEEWTEDEMVRRMLRAALGQEKDAVQLLVKAIEHRVRERDLFRSMLCEVTCDIRVIGRDTEGRPTIYICARSQSRPLKDLKAQIFLAFETAVKLGSPDGQSVLIADMAGFSARLNMDPFVLKDLADSFGTMFADRLFSVLIIDFSLLAQTVWSTCRAIISERTQKKINFVGERQARKITQERFDRMTWESIHSAFDINRKYSSTAEDRASHAQRTSISEVPLGICTADKAG